VLQQEPAPAEVVVWHNAPCSESIVGVKNIWADTNYGCQARHAAALLLSVDAVVFVDDDIHFLHPGVCAKLLGGLIRHPLSVVGAIGRLINHTLSGPYWDDPQDYFHEERPVGMVKGLLHAVRQPLLHHAFSLTLDQKTREEDDIVLNASVQLATAAPSWIVDINHTDFKAVKTDNGNQNRPDHRERRDSACKALVSLGWRPEILVQSVRNTEWRTTP